MQQRHFVEQNLMSTVFLPSGVRVVALCAFSAAALWSAPALATNQGTKNGVRDAGCTLNWGAAAVLKTDLKNDDPRYPNLMMGLDGVTPTLNYSNGGYIEEVNTLLENGPGLLEMNHFYTGAGNLMMVWRMPIGTLYPIAGATLTFTPPSISGATWTFDPASTNSMMHLWGGGYAQYAFTERSLSATSNPDGSFTVNLGDFDAGTGTVIQFNYTWPAGSTPWTHYHVASAKMTGTYSTPGKPATCALVKPVTEPTPVPTLSEWALVVLSALLGAGALLVRRRA